jgi:hypothetical protein
MIRRVEREKATTKHMMWHCVCVRQAVLFDCELAHLTTNNKAPTPNQSYHHRINCKSLVTTTPLGAISSQLARVQRHAHTHTYTRQSTRDDDVNCKNNPVGTIAFEEGRKNTLERI